VRGEVACPEGMTATVCLDVRIKNYGESAGNGFCRLLGHEMTPEEGEITVEGPRVELRDFGPGAILERILPWTKERPRRGFSGFCEPGLST
jgi:hypothetical protein